MSLLQAEQILRSQSVAARETAWIESLLDASEKLNFTLVGAVAAQSTCVFLASRLPTSLLEISLFEKSFRLETPSLSKGSDGREHVWLQSNGRYLLRICRLLWGAQRG